MHKRCYRKPYKYINQHIKIYIIHHQANIHVRCYGQSWYKCRLHIVAHAPIYKGLRDRVIESWTESWSDSNTGWTKARLSMTRWTKPKIQVKRVHTLEIGRYVWTPIGFNFTSQALILNGFRSLTRYMVTKVRIKTPIDGPRNYFQLQ